MTDNTPTDPTPIQALLAVMAQLRNPDGGCPWDLEQNFRTIAPYAIEEAYEVADAIEKNDMAALKDELGDLLFQTVFHAQLAKEAGLFDFDDVASAISDKMRRRHPHVFAEAKMRDAEAQTRAWEAQKAAERAAKGQQSLLDDVPVGLPSLTRAVKLQKRAARVGFDWTRASDVLSKIAEEAAELTEAVETGERDQIEDEFGDLLFVLANLSRHLNIDPEASLRRTNAKFIHRFRHMERAARHSGSNLDDLDLNAMEALWLEAKEMEG